MKKCLLFLLILPVLLLGCPMAGGGVTEPETLNTVLANLPEFQVYLPDSLTGTETSPSQSRAVGDITVMNKSNLNSIKSEGWQEMQDNIGMDQTTKMFLEIIKSYAAQHTIKPGSVISLGSQSINATSIEKCNLLINGSANDFEVFWYLEIPPGTNGNTEPIPVYMYLDVDKSSGYYAVSLEMYYQMSGVDARVKSYFDESTGESLLAASMGDFGSIKKSTPNGDGSHTVVIKDISGVSEGMSIGWGDDIKGGLASRWSNDYLNLEFYNHQGDLIQNGWGETTLDTYWFDEVTNSIDDENVKDHGYSSAPSEVYLKRHYYSSEDDEISFDGNTFTDLNKDVETLYFKAGTDWDVGDCIYQYDHYDYTGQYAVYTIGSTMPEGITLFGNTFYMYNEYPLKQLLPLKGQYEGMELLSEEGETFNDSWTWTDENGVEHTEEWNYTCNSFFVDTDSSGEFSNDDIYLGNIDYQDVYYWDSSRGDYNIEKGVFYMSDEALPSYFSYDSSYKDKIDQVKAKLNEIYTSDFVDFDLEDIPFINPLSSFPDKYDQLD